MLEHFCDLLSEMLHLQRISNVPSRMRSDIKCICSALPPKRMLARFFRTDDLAFGASVVCVCVRLTWLMLFSLIQAPPKPLVFHSHSYKV